MDLQETFTGLHRKAFRQRIRVPEDGHHPVQDPADTGAPARKTKAPCSFEMQLGGLLEHFVDDGPIAGFGEAGAVGEGRKLRCESHHPTAFKDVQHVFPRFGSAGFVKPGGVTQSRNVFPGLPGDHVRAISL